MTDHECRLYFAPTLWKGQDPILKERLFGLTGPEGHHGEDVKELYCHLDATPTHSHGKALSRYPQKRYPYQRLIDETRTRGLRDPEFELADTGILDEDRFSDLTDEYAKAGPDDNLFHEYFHAETGAGLGASHQTGWTALVARLPEDQGRRRQGTPDQSREPD